LEEITPAKDTLGKEPSLEDLQKAKKLYENSQVLLDQYQALYPRKILNIDARERERERVKTVRRHYKELSTLLGDPLVS
jgi:hypothetical protein